MPTCTISYEISTDLQPKRSCVNPIMMKQWWNGKLWMKWSAQLKDSGGCTISFKYGITDNSSSIIWYPPLRRRVLYLVHGYSTGGIMRRIFSLAQVHVNFWLKEKGRAELQESLEILHTSLLRGMNAKSRPFKFCIKNVKSHRISRWSIFKECPKFTVSIFACSTTVGFWRTWFLE